MSSFDLVIIKYLNKDCMSFIYTVFMNIELLCKEELKQPPLLL